MFFEKLTQMLSNAFRPKPKYITVTPVTDGGPVAALPPATMPRHVAIIMDGNGRWAKQRNLPRSAGHAAGTEALRDIIRASDDWGIEALSLYAFSTENWARSREEVDALMGLLLKYFASEIDELDEKNVRITILGDVDGLPAPQRDAVVSAMDRTRNNDGLKLNIALNYGGRAELTRAARILARQVRDGVIDPEDIDEAMFAEELYTADSPDVDLLIRTSGEKRTSNFLPWQLTYAEFIFDDTYWPDFTRERYMKCLREYAGRERRFGREEAGPTEAAAATPGPKAPDREETGGEDDVLEVRPVTHIAEESPEDAPVSDDDDSGDDDVVLEVRPVTHIAEEPPKEAPVSDDDDSGDDDVVLEVKPVTHIAEESPEDAPVSDGGDGVVLEVRPVVHGAEAPTREPAAVKLAMDAPGTSSAPESEANEAVPEDFVLEITPVIDPRPADAPAVQAAPPAADASPAPAGDGSAQYITVPVRKSKGKKTRSRSKKQKNTAPAAKPGDAPKE